MNQLTQTFQDKSIEIILDEQNNPLFVVKDLCNALDIEHTSNAIAGLDEDEYLTVIVVRSGQKRNMLLVRESGLYAVIFKSRKPEAKKFRKWVTNEVLPSIRKTGSYGVPKQNQNFVCEGTIPVDTFRAIINLQYVEDRNRMFDAVLDMAKLQQGLTN